MESLYFPGATALACLPLGGSLGLQDGAICNGYLFRLSAKGTCYVFRLADMAQVANFQLDKLEQIVPHSNSVFFGTAFYREDDPFPLLYTNLYNNYPGEKEGVCCVYRIKMEDGVFSSRLVQVLRVDFVKDGTLWCSQTQKDVRPYGNFVADTATGQFYAFVMRDEDRVTRFFRFALPAFSQGAPDEELGVPVYVLTKAHITQQFDTQYMHYMQGAACHEGLIYSVEGFSYPKSKSIPTLRIIDTNRQAQVFSADLTQYGLVEEPEFLEVYEGKLYYADHSGATYLLEFL